MHFGRWSLALLLLFAEPSADDIVRRADRVRTPEGGTALNVKVTVIQNGKVEYVRGFGVFGKGNDKTLVKFTSPKSEVGKALLMLGRDLWIYLPDVSKPVRIPLAVLTVRAGRWDLRIGRQQVVWGEAVGLFFADVVNPKDWREFLLRDFGDIRVPLWGVDALYDAGKNRVLGIFWSPEVRFSKLPVAGAEFEFFMPPPPAGVNVVFVPVAKPPRSLKNSNFGVRYSWLKNGWDAAVFYHRAFDDLPAISKNQSSAGFQPASRQDVGAPVSVSLLHPQVNRLGATVSKSIGSGVWRSEAVFTSGKLFEAETPTPAIKRNALTAMVGANYSVSRYNLDAQLFQTAILGDAQPLRDPKTRTGFSLRFADDASLRRVKPAVLFVMSLNQSDVWFSPKVDVRLSDDTTLTLGVDWFNGRRDTPVGQFRDAKRAQVKVTRRF